MQKATGDKLYFDILDENRLSILQSICKSGLADDFYLGGGTALSLQLNLRKSYDFDFFTEKPFNEELLLNNISALFPDAVQALQISKGTCDLLVRDVQMSFFQYPYPRIGSPAGSAEVPGLSLASVYDIAVMKFSAIGGRGSKKDFFDLYQIYKTVPGYNSLKLINDTRRKFGIARDLSYMYMGLSYFDDADSEVLPECFVEYDWEDIKSFFIKEQENIGQLL